MRRSRRITAKRLQHGQPHRQCQRKGQQIRGGLGILHARKPQKPWQDKDDRNQKQSLPRGSHHRRLSRHPDGLQQHRTQDDPDRQHQRQALCAQRSRADDHDIGVIPEQPDQLRRKGEAQHRQRRHRATAQADAEIERLPHTGALARAVVCAAHRLEALPKADKRRVCEH